MIHPSQVELYLMDGTTEIYEFPTLIELINGGVKISTIEKKDGVVTHIHEWWPGHQIKRVMYSKEVEA